MQRLSAGIAGSESLAAMAMDYARHFGNVTRRASAPEVVAHPLKSKAQGGEVEICTPGQMEMILHAAPPHLIPLLAIGAFAGIRMPTLSNHRLN